MADYSWNQGLQGAGGGALAGFSRYGPVGALVGGGLGLLGGFGGGESEEQRTQRQRLEAYYSEVGGRQAPQMGPAAQGGYSDFRANQRDLIGRLEALSQGRGPSLAAQQFQAATDRNMAAQQSMAQSGRGGPLAAFNAANNMGQLGAQAAQGSAAARTQEQQMALNQLGLTLHGARGADEDMNRFNAGQTNQMSAANLDAQLRAMGMNDQARLAILGQIGGQNQANAAQVGLGTQILAGGAGYAAHRSTLNALAAGNKNATPGQAARLSSGASSPVGGLPNRAPSIYTPYGPGNPFGNPNLG